MSVSLERIKVLVVDDNRHMINIVKTILRGFGILDIREADNAADALHAADSYSFDLIITDYMMAPVDGCQLTRQLRCGDGGSNRFVPVIMLSAYAERAKVETARDAGITEFCTKPVAPADLYRKFAMATNHPRPFVRTSVYAGPDRRRKVGKHLGPERREGPAQSQPAPRGAAG